MTQSIMLHHILRAPSTLYANLQTVDQLKKTMTKQGIETGRDADAWFDAHFDALMQTCEQYSVSRLMFEPLYIEREIVKQIQVLDREADTLILNVLKTYDKTALGIDYAKTKIDFYNLKRLLMFDNILTFDVCGYLEESFIRRYMHDVKALVFASQYHELANQINIKNIEEIERSVLKQKMEPYRLDGNSDNGLFAKVFFCVLELFELRARMKSVVFGLDERQVVRVYE